MRDKVKQDKELRNLLAYWVNFGDPSKQDHYIDCVIEAVITTYEKHIGKQHIYESN